MSTALKFFPVPKASASLGVFVANDITYADRRTLTDAEIVDLVSTQVVSGHKTFVSGIETSSEVVTGDETVQGTSTNVDLEFTHELNGVPAATFAYLDGVSAPIQEQIDLILGSMMSNNGGSAGGVISFNGSGGSDVNSQNFIVHKHMTIGDDSSYGLTVNSTVKVNATDVSPTEISRLAGVTSSIQSQLNAKAPSADPTFTGTVTGVSKTHVGLGNCDNTSDASKPVSTAQQTALDLKANLASPSLSGNPTCPNQSAHDNSTRIANTGYVDSAIANLVNSAPGTLDTLGEIATELANNESAAAALAITVGQKANSASPTLTGDTIIGTSLAGQSLLIGTNTTFSAGVTVSGLSDVSLAGNCTCTTQSLANSTTRLANTSYVQQNLANYQPVINSGARLNANLVGAGTVSSTTFGYLDATSSVQTQLDAKLSTSTAASTYAPLASPSLTGTASMVVAQPNRLLETVTTSNSFSSNNLTISNVDGAVFAYTLASNTNFTCTITNVNTGGAAYRAATFVLYLNPSGSVYKAYANAISVNGSSYTPIFPATPDLSRITTSSGRIVQTFTVVFLASGAVDSVTSNVTAYN